jgi:hypothetical protein
VTRATFGQGWDVMVTIPASISLELHLQGQVVANAATEWLVRKRKWLLEWYDSSSLLLDSSLNDLGYWEVDGVVFFQEEGRKGWVENRAGQRLCSFFSLFPDPLIVTVTSGSAAVISRGKISAEGVFVRDRATFFALSGFYESSVPELGMVWGKTLHEHRIPLQCRLFSGNMMNPDSDRSRMEWYFERRQGNNRWVEKVKISDVYVSSKDSQLCVLENTILGKGVYEIHN